MKISLNIPDYEGKGIHLEWDDYFILRAMINSKRNIVTISGNNEGLISLARHLLTLAQSNVPIGKHIHFDSLNSLEEGSCGIVIEKI
ncbi:MAG: hypothetical protein AAGU05_04785 [Anaerolineaceae bacterium]